MKLDSGRNVRASWPLRRVNGLTDGTRRGGTPSSQPSDRRVVPAPEGAWYAVCASDRLRREPLGITLMDRPGFAEGDSVEIRCIDGELHPGELAELPLYDKQAEIPRGKLVDIPAKR